MSQSGFSATINGREHFATDAHTLVNHAVNELASLGINAFGDMEGFIHFLIQLGEDPVSIISLLTTHILQYGGDVRSVLEEVANGVQSYGLTGYFTLKTNQALSPAKDALNEQMVRGNQIAEVHHTTLSTMQTRLDMLTASSNVPGMAWQGTGADAMSASFGDISQLLNQLNDQIQHNSQQAILNRTFLQVLEFAGEAAKYMAIADILLVIASCVIVVFTGGTAAPLALLLDTGILELEINILLVLVATDALSWLIGTLAIYRINHPIIQLASSSAASGSGSVPILTPGERTKAVKDAWNAIDKELGNIGKNRTDLIKIVGSEAALAKMIEMLVCMGYSSTEIMSLLTSLVTSTTLTTPYTVPSSATGVTVTGSDTLPDVFQKLYDANATGNSVAYKGAARMIKAILESGPQNIAGIDVQYTNPSGDNSDADIITKNGDIYEIGGSDKINKFGDQDIAAKEFIDHGGTGNTNGDIHLWMDADGKEIDLARANYETGVPPNPRNPNKAPYQKWVTNPKYKKPADITQKTPPDWICGSGYVVK